MMPSNFAMQSYLARSAEDVAKSLQQGGAQAKYDLTGGQPDV